MASAIASVQRMPDRSMPSLIKFLQAPSTTGAACAASSRVASARGELSRRPCDHAARCGGSDEGQGPGVSGALDPFITLENVITFASEMQAAGVDFQVILYGGAKHGFTNPAADRLGRPGVAYHAPSDVRSC